MDDNACVISHTWKSNESNFHCCGTRYMGPIGVNVACGLSDMDSLSSIVLKYIVVCWSNVLEPQACFRSWKDNESPKTMLRVFDHVSGEGWYCAWLCKPAKYRQAGLGDKNRQRLLKFAWSSKQRPAKGFATGNILCVCLYNFYLRFSVNFTGAESALAGFPKLINLKLRIIITLRSHDFWLDWHSTSTGSKVTSPHMKP